MTGDPAAAADPGLRTYVFDTTTGALWAEEAAHAAGLVVELVPAPAGADAVCDLAMQVRAAEAARLEEVLRGEGVPFRPWPDDAAGLSRGARRRSP